MSDSSTPDSAAPAITPPPGNHSALENLSASAAVEESARPAASHRLLSFLVGAFVLVVAVLAVLYLMQSMEQAPRLLDKSGALPAAVPPVATTGIPDATNPSPGADPASGDLPAAANEAIHSGDENSSEMQLEEQVEAEFEPEPGQSAMLQLADGGMESALQQSEREQEQDASTDEAPQAENVVEQEQVEAPGVAQTEAEAGPEPGSTEEASAEAAEPHPLADSRSLQVVRERLFLIEFEQDSATLSSAALDVLERALDSLLASESSAAFVTGYEEPDGAEASTSGLSYRRAISVARFLLQNGVGRERVQVIGDGAKRLSEKEDGATVRNELSRGGRRVEVRVRTPDQST